jgi:hypothetical protein
MAQTKVRFDRAVEGATNIVDSGTEGTKVATGTTAQRGSTTGQWRYNTTTGFFEGINTGGSISSLEPDPIITSISPTTETDANANIVITGENFFSGSTVKFIGNDGTEYTSPSVTVNSTSQITATTPSTPLTVANEPYDVKVISATNKTTTLDDALDAGGSPTWITASGNLGTVTEQDSVNITVSANDPDGQTIIYSETGGTVLSSNGLTLNSSTGAITGTAPSVSSDTTLSFTIRASDGTNNTDRAFSFVVQNDVLLDGLVAWYQTGGETDSSGNNYTGSFSGSNSSSISTVTDSGTPLGSRSVTSYPDSDGYCALPLSTIITGTNARTITCWVKPSGTLDDQDYIFGFGYCSSGAKATFNARCGGSKMGFMGCGADYDNNGDVVYSSGTWVRIFYTFSGTNTVSAYYLDGSGNRVTSWTTNISGLSTSSSSATASIGAHASSPGGDIGGCNSRIADFRIYNRVLSEAEMESLYNK